jgi:radical SAM protein with 4Fe4S-binding SPASM domain
LPDGKVMACRRLNLIIGDLNKQKLNDIWVNSEVLNNLRDKSKVKVCGKCNYWFQCGGCRALAHAIYGDYLGKDPQCWKNGGN